uniref:Uncharacterized protein n=1 Tax=Panagrolaimus sp. JU765 TaxID=591449 RepID=A0AC34QQR5_9BILA
MQNLTSRGDPVDWYDSPLAFDDIVAGGFLVVFGSVCTWTGPGSACATTTPSSPGPVLPPSSFPTTSGLSPDSAVTVCVPAATLSPSSRFWPHISSRGTSRFTTNPSNTGCCPRTLRSI